ncbi:Ankyrin repeat domain-containing protein 42 [Phlyctochytrium bullatum]|nr:Ankyrin repeat domain-containing protein 42 [Phlyctochytrium bullatum]
MELQRPSEKRLRSAPSPLQNAASCDTSLHPNPKKQQQQQQQRSNVFGLHSLPVELARRILLVLHPIHLMSLSVVSRDVRMLFRPADTEVQFARNHLLAHFPELRNKDSDTDSDSYDSDIEVIDTCGIYSQDGSYSDYSDECSDSDDGGCKDGHFEGSVSDASGGEDDHKSKESLVIYDECNNDLRRQVGARLRSLPLCYALALIKLEGFDKRIIKIMTYVKTRYHSEHNIEAEKKRDILLFERILLVGVCELGMGFDKAEYNCEGRWYQRKEACDKVRSWIGMTGSIEAAQRIIEMVKNSVTMLPPGHVRKKKSKREHVGHPTDISESTREVAYEACVQGTVPLLQFLLDTYPESFSDLDMRLVNGATYLQTAFRFGHEDVISTLVDYMKRPLYGKATGAADPAQRYNPTLSMRDRKSGQSFLQAAIHDRNEPMVRTLLELGADPNFFPPAPSPVRCAVYFQNCFCNDWSDDDSRDCGACFLEKDTPLSIACSLDDSELISLLVAYGADPLSCSTQGETVLMECWSVKAAVALLEAVEAHAPHAMHDLLVAQCARGDNILHKASKQNNYELFTVVLQAITKAGGSDDVWAIMKTIFATRTRGGGTPLSLACLSGDASGKEVLDAMFDKADPGTLNEMRRVLLLGDRHDRTPVHIAAMRGHEETLRKTLAVLLAADDGICQEVLGMEVGNHGYTPLHYAAERGCLACVQMLLEHGADPGLRDRSGRTPLMIAEGEQHLDLVRVLREVTPK